MPRTILGMFAISVLMLTACTPSVFTNADAEIGFSRDSGFLTGAPDNDRITGSSDIEIMLRAVDNAAGFSLWSIAGSNTQAYAFTPDSAIISSILEGNAIQVDATFSVILGQDAQVVLHVGEPSIAPLVPISIFFENTGGVLTARIGGSDQPPVEFEPNKDMYFNMIYYPETGTAFLGVFQSGTTQLWDRFDNLRILNPGIRWDISGNSGGANVFVRSATVEVFEGGASAARFAADGYPQPDTP